MDLRCPSIKELKTAFSFAQRTKQTAARSVLLLHSGIMSYTPLLDNVDLSSDEGAEPIQDGLPLDHLADVALPRHDSLRSQDATQYQEVECPQGVKNAFNDTRQRGTYTSFK
jgi:hypothetical protein